jgi:hypothetical protein
MRKLLRKIIVWALDAEQPRPETEQEFRARVVRALAGIEYDHDPRDLDKAARN